jgi:hypothetical protein
MTVDGSGEKADGCLGHRERRWGVVDGRKEGLGGWVVNTERAGEERRVMVCRLGLRVMICRERRPR